MKNVSAKETISKTIAEAKKVKQDTYPLTPSQMGVYFACINNPDSTLYNIPLRYTFSKDSNINIERLKSAVKNAIENHVGTNYVITEETGLPAMKEKKFEVEIPIEKIPKEKLEKALEDFVRPFDLTEGPLYRYKIFETEDEYVLIGDYHHIAFDGTSTSKIESEIEASYDGKELEPEEVSIFDLSVFEEKIKETEAYQNSHQFFKDRFDEAEVSSKIPFDYEEEESLTHPNHRIVRFVPKVLEDKSIEDFLEKSGLTENSLFLGTLFYTTAKYLGQDESLIFAVNHGRSDKSMRNTVGMMLKPLPLQMKIDENESVLDFLKRVQQNQHDTAKNSLYSFQELAKEYGFDVDIQFIFQKNIGHNFKLGGEPVELYHPPVKDAMSPFSLTVMQKENGYDLEFEYQGDLYESETIDNFANFYMQILGEILEKENLNEIVLTNESEFERILNISRDEEIESDLSQLFLDQFKSTLEAYPDQTALEFEDKSFSYKEIDEISTRLAQKLINSGIKKNDIVGILIERNEFMVILPLAVLKAGAAYLPLDLKSPQDRLEFMLEDSNVPLVLADEKLLDKIPGFNGEILTTDEVLSLKNTGESLPEISPEDLFIIIYTSGSTGLPKGVEISHKNIANLINWSSQIDELSTDSKYALHSNFSFDPHLMGTYPVLSRGGTVYVIPEEKRLDLMWFNEYCLEKGITNTDLTTQIARTYMSAIEDIAPLRITTGGEKLPAIHPREGVTFLNQYGPTECTVVTTNFPVEEYSESIPIGKPVGNAHLYVIDDELRMLPKGAIGELAVAGPMVAQGYHNLPEKTSEVFIPNPFEKRKDYETLYRTGDLVRFKNDGNLDIFGRQDEMVKIRGYRIELSEVNSAIASFEPVKDSFVVAYDKEDGGQYLVSYIVSDNEIDISELRDYIAKIKPDYMIPEAFIQIDSIPLTSNGKVNKKLLPKPEENQMAPVPVSSEKTLSVLEEKILDILEGITNTREIPIDQDLKFYGITSISAITLAIELKNKLGIDVDIKSLLNSASILSIENEIITKLLEGGLKTEPVELVQKVYRQPLSNSQFGVYTESMKNPDDSFYNIPFYFTLPESTDLERLEKALKDTVEAHDYLNTIIKLDEEGVIQSKEDRTVSIPIRDMTEEDFEQYKNEFNRPFKMLESPLYRIEIVRTEEHTYLLLNFHHLIFDGFSSDIFTRDLARAYNGEELERESFDYYDYVENEKSESRKEEVKEAKAYFSKMLESMEGSSSLPTIQEERRLQGESKLISTPFDLEKVEIFCKERSITPAQFFLAVTLYTVARYTNSEGAFINTISNGRNDLDYRDTFGMFVKTLPIGTILDKGSVEEFITHSAKLLTETVQNDSYPYYEIAREFNYSPNILYAYQLGIGEPTKIEGEALEREQLAPREAKFDTGVYIEKLDGENVISILYDAGSFDTDLMNNFLKSIKNVSESFLENPNNDLRSVSVLENDEKKLLESFSVSKERDIDTKGLHELLEKQAAENGENIALVASDGTFTYNDLNAKANRIANSLIKKGVKKGDRIALLLNRDSSFLSSLYGILKAGAAFIPITKQYPINRVKQILDDSNARFIITTEDEIDNYENSLNVLELESENESSNPNITTEPEDLAYLIYTSGSTGKPKGVLLKHEGIVNYVTPDEANTHVAAIVENGNAVGSITSVGFDMSLKETVLSLSNGLTLIFADEEQVNNPKELARFFKENHADVFSATPSRLQIYMEDPDFLEFLKECKVIIAGAEKYPQKLLEDLQSTTDAELFNTYGPTEITVSSNAKNLTKSESVTIGKPLLNVKEYILDSDLNPVPIGVTGELLIGGKGVALGYNNLPEETERAFIEVDGERLYKTGDLARWTVDGEVEILGRNDNQIKLRGLRIELNEIESVLTKTGFINTAYATVKEINGNETLCLYYTADDEVESPVLKESLKKSLPDYMIPEYFIKLDQIPVTVNGKIDLKNLPEPKIEKRISTEEKAANYTEQEIIDIFKEVLNLDSVSRKDDFFELGGSSLMVTRVVIEAGKRHLNIAYGDLFEHPTPEMLAHHLTGSDILDSNLDDYRDYDYSRINEVLAENTLENFINGERQELGDVVLAGATGFLGVHILDELLKTTDSHIYLFQRGKKRGQQYSSPEERIEALYYYYFDDNIFDLYGDRITVIEGDITNEKSFKGLEAIEADTFINCAANVKHYAEGSEIEEVDYNGVLNIIDYCKESDTKLIHVSTMSIGGIFLDHPGEVSELKEDQLFFGQFQNSKYTSSKFLAERAILEEVANGLNAKIMRVGNLSPRESDGEFQINFTTNTFMGRLRAISQLGYYPYESMDNKFELSPIDYVAKAILKLAQSPKENTVLHPFNNHSLLMYDLYNQLESIGKPVSGIENEDFNEVVKKALEDPEMAKILSSFIAYENSAHGRKIYSVTKNNDMTMQMLYRLGFHWPVTSIDYMKKFLHSLSDMLFFDYLF